MWGRWSLRNNLTKTFISSNPAELGKLFRDDRIEIISIKDFPLPDEEKVCKFRFIFRFILLGRRFSSIS